MNVHCRMPAGDACDVRPGETLLQACLRSAVSIPFSCAAGVCHTCLMRAVEGTVPVEAQKGLPPHLRARGYFLPCLCRPEGPLVVAPPDAADLLVEAVVCESRHAGPFLHLELECTRSLQVTVGDRVLLCAQPEGERVTGEITACDAQACQLEILVADRKLQTRWLQRAEFGTLLWVAAALEGPAAEEEPQPAPDPGLWRELGEGALVRRVLEAFYARVYADPQLAPFFRGVTLDRSVDKQYSFLRQLMTGERVYFGDRPRNAHHWMVIGPELFEYRQQVMRETLQAHGLDAGRIARWMRLELPYRRDIVKSAAWPRVVDGVAQHLEGYARERLAEATLCDHCGDAVDAGTEVAYHLRLGTVSCPECSSGDA
jgi:truncated hemoglobin YjbI/ferredoxin